MSMAVFVVSTVLFGAPSFEPFFFCGNFGILLFNPLGKLFFAFFSCVGVDIELFAFAVRQFRRIAAFPFLFADSKYAPRFGAAYLRLFRLKFRSYGRFRRSVGRLPVLAQSTLISCRNPVRFRRRRCQSPRTGFQNLLFYKNLLRVRFLIYIQ